jgi:hypothetical protein
MYGALNIGVLHAGETDPRSCPAKEVVLLRWERSRRRHDQLQLRVGEPDPPDRPSGSRLAGAARRPTRSRLS